MTFSWWDLELDYCQGDYNHARRSERAVEVPIASWWVDQRQGDGLEVGNVLSHYRDDIHWDVLDRYEVAPGVINVDVFEWEITVDWIVSVSTLEHIRWDETPREAGGSVKALHHLYNLLGPGGQMLVTIPLGWNRPLDDDIALDLTRRSSGGKVAPSFEGLVRACTFVREDGRWVQTPAPLWRPYGDSWTSWAGSVWVAEFTKALDAKKEGAPRSPLLPVIPVS